MEDYGRSHNIKYTNKIRSAKDYIARKKAKSANQNHKGLKKDKKHDHLPGGNLYSL
jgi:hypothetical protein